MERSPMSVCDEDGAEVGSREDLPEVPTTPTCTICLVDVDRKSIINELPELPPVHYAGYWANGVCWTLPGPSPPPECFDRMAVERLLPCLHLVHRVCLNRWNAGGFRVNTCSFCRGDVESTEEVSTAASPLYTTPGPPPEPHSPANYWFDDDEDGSELSELYDEPSELGDLEPPEWLMDDEGQDGEAESGDDVEEEEEEEDEEEDGEYERDTDEEDYGGPNSPSEIPEDRNTAAGEDEQPPTPESALEPEDPPQQLSRQPQQNWRERVAAWLWPYDAQLQLLLQFCTSKLSLISFILFF